MDNNVKSTITTKELNVQQQQTGQPQSKLSQLTMQQQTSLQRVSLKKQQIKQWPKQKKLEKLAIYSACKFELTDNQLCKCVGFKHSQEKINSSSAANENQNQITSSLPCKNCQHSFESHTAGLLNLDDNEINRLLSLVVDVEKFVYVCAFRRG